LLGIGQGGLGRLATVGAKGPPARGEGPEVLRRMAYALRPDVAILDVRPRDGDGG
jgi:hypothetical protein